VTVKKRARGYSPAPHAARPQPALPAETARPPHARAGQLRVAASASSPSPPPSAALAADPSSASPPGTRSSTSSSRHSSGSARSHERPP